MQLELRKSLRAKGYQPDVGRQRVDGGEVHLVAAHQQFDGEHPAAAERVDDAGGDRARRVERGERQPLRLPRLQRSPSGARRCPIGSQNCTAGPDGSVVRTVSSVTSSSTSTTVSASTRFGERRRRLRSRRCHAASTSSGRSQHRLAVGGGAGDGRDQRAGSRRARRRRASSSAETANQNGTVGRPSSSAASLRSPSRSALSRVPRGVGNTSTRVALGRGDQHRRRDVGRHGDDVVRADARRAGRSSRVGVGARLRRRRRRRRAAGRPAPARDRGHRCRAAGQPGVDRSIHSSPDQPARPSARSRRPEIDVAPAPALARLHRPHDRMSGLLEVRGGVLVRARVAAADVAARQAHPQVRPGGLAVFGAFLAAARRQRLRLGRARRRRRGARTSCGDGRGIPVAWRVLLRMLVKDRPVRLSDDGRTA